MVHTDRGNAANVRLHDVCGVYSTSHTDLDNSHVALSVFKVEESHERADVEEGQGCLECYLSSHHLIRVSNYFLLADHAPVYQNTFAEAANMWGCEESDFQTS